MSSVSSDVLQSERVAIDKEDQTESTGAKVVADASFSAQTYTKHVDNGNSQPQSNLGVFSSLNN